MMLNKASINPSKEKLILYIVLIMVTIAVYWQVNQCDFIALDDTVYVTGNDHVQSGLTLTGIMWAFSTMHAEFWHPLTWISLMFDYRLYGLNAGGYHVTNLVFHILSTLLLFWLFNRMTGEIWKSAFVAALFALHPLNAEPVAWIAKRKDVLSIFFGMLTLCLYVYYTEKPAIKRYLLVLVSFALALMSKPMVVTLPAIMILLDFWPLNRREWKKDNPVLWQLKEKAPFFILSAILTVITFFSQHAPYAESFSPGIRTQRAFVSFITYIGKILWPGNLAVYYPFSNQIHIWQVMLSVLLIAAISIWVMVLFRRLPYLFVGWLWYTIAIFPVIGILHAPAKPVSDHYAYLPSIGISMMLAWGVPLLFPRENIRKKFLLPAAVILICLLCILTRQQCSYWKNGITLFNHALTVTENNAPAHTLLGSELAKKGMLREALYHHNEAIRIIPDFSDAYLNKGVLYIKQGKYQDAIDDFSEAIRLKPFSDEAYMNRGSAYVQTGQYEKAIENYEQALRVIPSSASSYNGLGCVYAETGQYLKAIENFNKAIVLKKDFGDAYYNRGLAYTKLRQYQPAFEDFNRSILLKPKYSDAFYNRGVIYLSNGYIEPGCRDAGKACSLGNCELLKAARAQGYCR